MQPPDVTKLDEFAEPAVILKFTQMQVNKERFTIAFNMSYGIVDVSRMLTRATCNPAMFSHNAQSPSKWP